LNPSNYSFLCNSLTSSPTQAAQFSTQGLLDGGTLHRYLEARRSRACVDWNLCHLDHLLCPAWMSRDGNITLASFAARRLFYSSNPG
jgi:hypothetical protein